MFKETAEAPSHRMTCTPAGNLEESRCQKLFSRIEMEWSLEEPPFLKLSNLKPPQHV